MEKGKLVGVAARKKSTIQRSRFNLENSLFQ